VEVGEEEGEADDGLPEEPGGMDGGYQWRREGRKEELMGVYLRRREGRKDGWMEVYLRRREGRKVHGLSRTKGPNMVVRWSCRLDPTGRSASTWSST
jgi:hypothetical protein